MHQREKVRSSGQWCRRLGWAAVSLVVLTASGSWGELAPIGPNVFGDLRPASAESSQAQRQRKLQSEHILVTNADDHLVGLLADYRAGFVHWQHPDLPQPLKIPVSDIRHILLSPPLANQVRFLRVCLKLSGGDWIAGNITSPDGCGFEWEHSSGFRWIFSRADIAWISATTLRPYPVGFAHSPRELRGWRTGSGAEPAFENGEIVLRAADSLHGEGDFKLPLEIAFTIPAESERGLQVSLEAINAFLEGAATGAHLKFDTGKIACSTGAADKEAQLLEWPSNQTVGEKVRYQLLWDRQRAKLHVGRNGRLVGTFLIERFVTPSMRYRVRFQGSVAVSSQPLRFSRLQIAPWNQVLPPDGRPEADLPEKGGTEFGDLTFLDHEMSTFAGRTNALTNSRFFNFFQDPVPLDRAEAILDLGDSGQITIDRMAFTNTHIHGRTSFADRFSLPRAMVQTIIPIACTPASTASRDTLVLKNGDHFTRKVVEVAQGRSVRFEAYGETFEVAYERLAGVQFAKSETSKPDGSVSVRLRNGDCLVGDLESLNRTAAKIIHPWLGTLEVPRGQLDGICLDSRFRVEQGVLSLRPQLPSSGIFTFNGLQVFSSEGDAWRDRSPIVYVPPEEFPHFEVHCATEWEGTSNRLRVRFNDEAERDVVELNLTHARVSTREPKRVSETHIGSNPEILFRAFVRTPKGPLNVRINDQWRRNFGPYPRRLRSIAIDGFARQTPLVLHHLLALVWQKEPPADEDNGSAMTLLKNGDVGLGAPDGLRDGRFSLTRELAAIEVDAGRVSAILFGEKPTPQRAAGRLRLHDGTALLVESFRLERPHILARSLTFGELRLSIDAVAEIVFDPPPIRAPRNMLPDSPKKN